MKLSYTMQMSGEFNGTDQNSIGGFLTNNSAGMDSTRH